MGGNKNDQEGPPSSASHDKRLRSNTVSTSKGAISSK